MLQTMRNFFAKSGGLLLLILAFLIVGILAFLTIRAAQRGVQTVAELDGDSPTVIVDDTSDSSNVEVVGGDDSQSSSSSDSAGSSDSSTATESETGDSNDEDSVAGTVAAPDDEASSTTDSSSTNIGGGAIGGGDDEGQVAGATDTNNDTGSSLPNTGPAETALVAVVGIIAVAVLGSRWDQSRKQLAQSLRR